MLYISRVYISFNPWERLTPPFKGGYSIFFSKTKNDVCHFAELRRMLQNTRDRLTIDTLGHIFLPAISLRIIRKYGKYEPKMIRFQPIHSLKSHKNSSVHVMHLFLTFD